MQLAYHTTCSISPFCEGKFIGYLVQTGSTIDSHKTYQVLHDNSPEYMSDLIQVYHPHPISELKS